MITQDQINEARAIIKGKVHRTPLMPATSIGQKFGAQLFLKCENLQKTGSYKPRGGLNKVAHLSDEEKRRGLVVMSAGNLAQGVAFAARQVDVPCAVVMPSTAPIAKINAVKGYGAEVVLHDDPATWFDKVEEVRAQRGAVVVDPWGDPLLLAGYATIGMEIVEDLPDVDCVVVPVGGGSLIGGIASAIKLGRPSVRVIGVECASGTLMQQSLAAGKPLRITRAPSIADGLASPTTSELAVRIARQCVDEFVTVSDDEITEAMRWLLQRCKLLVEGAGAVGVAALLAGQAQVKRNAQVVAILSGGNVDFERLKSVL